MNKKILSNNKNGFIMLDVMLGLVILTVALTAIGGLYIQSSKSSIFADNRTIATNWAQERMEYLKSETAWRVGDNPNPPDGNQTKVGRVTFTRSQVIKPATLVALPVLVANPNPLLKTSVTDSVLLNAVNNRLYDTTVIVKWTENGVPQSVQLETLIDHD